jgi:hypothetical protein
VKRRQVVLSKALKRIFYYSFCIIVLAIPLISVSEDDPAKLILVLGFKSNYMSDLQDRLLREAVLRRLVEKGYRIVPVMKIERYFKSGRKNIRSIGISELKVLCEKLGADYAVVGSMARRRRSYVFFINIYEGMMESINRSRINISSKESFMQYCIPLSEEIVNRIEGVLR